MGAVPARNPRFRVLVPAVAILVCYGAIEAICGLGLFVIQRRLAIRYEPNISALSEQQKKTLQRFLETARRGERVSQDPVLGWVPRLGLNAAGMRDDREHDVQPKRCAVRISAFGDSFTYGSDVELEETWGKRLEQLNPRLEVLNYGAGAYGLDQAYLRYRLVGTTYRPHIVFIGYLSENILRHVSVFRAFYTTAYRDVIFTKPRFEVKDNELVLVPNPIATVADHERLLLHDREVLRELGRRDYHYQTNYNAGPFDILPTVRLTKMFWAALNQRVLKPIVDSDGRYRPDSEAYQVTIKIFEAFYRDALANGALPVILIFPGAGDQWRSRDGKPRSYAFIVEDLRRRGYRWIDAQQAFEPHASRFTVQDLTRQWGHYSPIGQQLGAEHIERQLHQLGLLDAENIRVALEADRRKFGLPSGSSQADAPSPASRRAARPAPSDARGGC